jgi:hypothetical protein
MIHRPGTTTGDVDYHGRYLLVSRVGTVHYLKDPEEKAAAKAIKELPVFEMDEGWVSSPGEYRAICNRPITMGFICREMILDREKPGTLATCFTHGNKKHCKDCQDRRKRTQTHQSGAPLTADFYQSGGCVGNKGFGAAAYDRAWKWRRPESRAAWMDGAAKRRKL